MEGSVLIIMLTPIFLPLVIAVSVVTLIFIFFMPEVVLFAPDLIFGEEMKW